MSKHHRIRHPQKSLTLDPEARARVLDQAREIAEELTAVLVQYLDKIAPPRRLQSTDTAIEEGWEHLAQAVALQALARLAQLKFPTPIEGQIIDQISAIIVDEVVRDG